MVVFRHKTGALVIVFVAFILCISVCSRQQHTETPFVANLVSISDTSPYIATISVSTHSDFARIATKSDVIAIADVALLKHSIYTHPRVRLASVDFYVPGFSVLWAQCIYERTGDDTHLFCIFSRNELSLPAQE